MHAVKRNAYKVLIGNYTGKRPLARPKHTWVDIKMDIKQIG
jgi:hypothetical protein